MYRWSVFLSAISINLPPRNSTFVPLQPTRIFPILVTEIVSAVTDGDGLARYLEHVGMGRDPPRVWGVRAAGLVFGEEF